MRSFTPSPLPSQPPAPLAARKQAILLLVGLALGVVALFAVVFVLVLVSPPSPSSDYQDSTSLNSSREPLEGQNAEAEKAIRDIESARPGYLKREDRTLIRAMIINDAKKNEGKGYE